MGVLTLCAKTFPGRELFPFTSHQSLLQFTVFIHATQKITAYDCLNFSEIQPLPAHPPHRTLSKHRGEFSLHWFGVGAVYLYMLLIEIEGLTQQISCLKVFPPMVSF